MPKKLERKSQARARKLRLSKRAYGAYVYGTMKKLGVA